MVRRRRMNVFSLSFLDVMSCGFGAVVLIFLIINHATTVESERSNSRTLASVSLVNREVTVGERDLAELRELLDEVELQLADSREQARLTSDEIDLTTLRLAQLRDSQNNNAAGRDELKSEVDRLEQEVAKLRSTRVSEDEEGQATRTFVGEGDRQYLTGLKVGGDRILIALDASASMLADDLVNVLRTRNMNPDRQRQSPKWRRAVRTVDWITAQMPLEARFQILLFAEQPEWLLPDSKGEWLDVAGGANLNRAVEALEEKVPSGGTSLQRAFATISELRPPPDNVFLIIDSLPTIGDKAPRRGTINGRDRIRLFEQALDEAPDSPINVILFPMEGDPYAAAAYWQLAQATGGAFMSPARDWP